MRLPESFQHHMKEILGEEFDEFLSVYTKNHYRGFILNTLKMSEQEFRDRFPHELKNVPWHPDGFYAPKVRALGDDPHHHAGLFYIQEPSAMAPAAVLDAKPGERILDLCAAPGGKSVSMAIAMENEGLLVANDTDYGRARTLSGNIERMGVQNALVTNHRAADLAKRLPGFFDAVMVDVPCSLEGMFRKEKEAISLYRDDLPKRLAPLQGELLENAHALARKGGRIVYSTCTLNTTENEGVVRAFLRKHPDTTLVPIKKKGSLSAGVDMKEALRIWPHRSEGEGHFVALLEKREDASPRVPPVEKGIPLPPLFEVFAKSFLRALPEGTLIRRKDTLHLFPGQLIALSGLKVLRAGIMLGEMKKSRFVPAHALAHALPKDSFQRTVDFGRESDEIKRYMRGETLRTTEKNGLVAVCVDGVPLGFAKIVDGVLKNHYPKGLRIY